MNKKLWILIISVLLVATIAAGCASEAQLAGTRWALVSYGLPANPTPALQEVETSVAFSKDSQVSGSMGCNSFGGGYRTQGGKIIFTSMASTMMACDEARMAQETAALAVLAGEATYTLEANRLTITSADGSQAVTLEKAP